VSSVIVGEDLWVWKGRENALAKLGRELCCCPEGSLFTPCAA
jgi:hypothetical protein